LPLYAALDVKTGKVQGKTAGRHTSAEFVDFLEQVVAGCKPRQEVHIILDNLSAHKTNQVEDFLTRNRHAKLHFTPTYSAWLNQVEIWFARLEREVIFTSVQDLSRKLMRYLRSYSKTARPFQWKYSDVRRRILPC
jgi:transposase